MLFQLTDDGVAALIAQSGNVLLTRAVFGDAFGYTPTPTSTGIIGTQVFESVPTAPVAQTANIVRYGAYMDFDVGPLQFGEVAFFMPDGKCFGVATNSVLIDKYPLSSNLTTANSIKLDVFVSMVDGAYYAWMDVAESNNKIQIPRIASVDALPQPKNATPNVFVVPGVLANQSATLAYTDRQGMWSFDAYAFAYQRKVTVTNFEDAFSIVVSANDVQGLNLDYYGHLIIQFSSGEVFGTCRYVSSLFDQGGSIRISWNTPMAILPQIGDTALIFARHRLAASSAVLPPATYNELGAVIVKEGLEVDADGNLSTKLQTVNGKEPDVNNNIHVTSSDVGAIPYAEKGVAGGVANLTDTSDIDPNAIWTYGRIPERQLPLSAWRNAGGWDADTNNTDDGLTLMSGGNFMVGSVVYNGSGSVFRVTVDGNTTLDGTSDWKVNDLAVSIDGQWLKFTSALRTQVYQLSACLFGDIPTSQTIYFIDVDRRMRTAGGTASCLVAPVATVTIQLYVRGVDAGYIRFEPGSTTGSVLFYPDVMEIGDRLEVLTPSTVHNIGSLSLIFNFHLL